MIRLLIVGFLFSTITWAYTNKRVEVLKIHHSPSEPRGLYIVTYASRYDESLQKYRVYCPTGMVREITNGSWQKARKAYQEDRVKYGSKRVVRQMFDFVCE